MLFAPSSIHSFTYSLLVAIGIEAFNKFSQEQKDEGKEAESQTPNPTYPESEKRSMKESCTYFGRRLLSGMKSFAGAALSSARVSHYLIHATVNGCWIKMKQPCYI